MPGAKVGNGKSVTLKAEFLLLLALWAPEFKMLCACFSEVPQVNIFLLPYLKLTEINVCMFRWPTQQGHWGQTMGLKSTPKVFICHLNLACQFEIEEHGKRRVLPNQSFFSFVPFTGEWQHHQSLSQESACQPTPLSTNSPISSLLPQKQSPTNISLFES